jgi:hypothetical protein
LFSRDISVHRLTCHGFRMISTPSRVLGRRTAIISSSAIRCGRLLGHICTLFLTGRAICTCGALSFRIAGEFPFPRLVHMLSPSVLLVFLANDILYLRYLGSYAVVFVCCRLPRLVVLQARSAFAFLVSVA